MLQTNQQQEPESAPFMRMFGNLMEYGLDLFEPDGTVNGIGSEMIELVLEYFDKQKSYGRCLFLRNLLDKYKQRWPYRQPNFNLN